MNIEPLICPACGQPFDEREILDESGIFSCPLNLVCHGCGAELQVRAEPVLIKWYIKQATRKDNNNE